MNETTSFTWSRLRNLVRNRDKSICYHCKKVATDGHCDHLIPVSKGGTDAIGNLVWSCKSCNLSKGNKLPSLPKAIGPEHPKWAETISHLMPQDDDIPIFETIIPSLVRLVVSKIIAPYPVYNNIEFYSWEHYCDHIKNMRHSKLSTWLRDCIWPVHSEYKNFLKSIDLEIIKPQADKVTRAWYDLRFASCPLCGLPGIYKISELRRQCDAGHIYDVIPDSTLYYSYVTKPIFPTELPGLEDEVNKILNGKLPDWLENIDTL